MELASFNQITIADFLKSLKPKKVIDDLETATIEDIIGAIHDELGIDFVFDDFFERYQHVYKKNKNHSKCTLSVELRPYAQSVNNGAMHIGVSIDTVNAGMGAPCDSLEQAINVIKHNLPRYLGERKAA